MGLNSDAAAICWDSFKLQKAGADLGKMLINLLQNERGRRKLLVGGEGVFADMVGPREIFSILTSYENLDWFP